MKMCSWVTLLVNNVAKEWCRKPVIPGDHFCPNHRAEVMIEEYL
jgi:hypothetical protein